MSQEKRSSVVIFIVALAGIAAISVIEISAIVHGIDSVSLSACVGAIAAIVGGVAGFKMKDMFRG